MSFEEYNEQLKATAHTLPLDKINNLIKQFHLYNTPNNEVKVNVFVVGVVNT